MDGLQSFSDHLVDLVAQELGSEFTPGRVKARDLLKEIQVKKIENTLVKLIQDGSIKGLRINHKAVGPSAEEIERINLTLEVEPQRPGYNPPYAGEIEDTDQITHQFRFNNPNYRLFVTQEKINSKRFRQEVLNPDFDLIVNKLVPDGSYKKPFIRYHQVHLQFSYSRYQCVPTRDLTGNLGNTPPFCSIFKFLPTLYGPFHLIENLPDGQLVVVPNFKRRARSRVVNYRVPGSNLKLQIRLKPEGEHANGFVTVIDTSGGSDQTIAENLAY